MRAFLGELVYYSVLAITITLIMLCGIAYIIVGSISNALFR